MGWLQGELEHRRVKRFYARTNKHNFTQQVATHERRQRGLMNIATRKNRDNSRTEDKEMISYTEPSQRYHISRDMRNDNLEPLPTLLEELGSDPAAEASVRPSTTTGRRH